MVINHYAVNKIEEILRDKYHFVGNLHITDLLCDVYHYMESKDMEPREVFKLAKNMYESEIK